MSVKVKRAIITTIIATFLGIIVSFFLIVIIQNDLLLPVEITIIYPDNSEDDQGVLIEQKTEVFFLTDIRANILVKLRQQMNYDGTYMGTSESWRIDRATMLRKYLISNVLKTGEIFYIPIITNNTASNCEIFVNDDNLNRERVGIIPPFTQSMKTGYYRLYNNSNVSLFCSSILYWSGIRGGKGLSLESFITPSSGALIFDVPPLQNQNYIYSVTITPTPSQFPIPQQTPIITRETPTNTPTPTPTETLFVNYPNNISAEQAIKMYFYLVNNQEYETTYFEMLHKESTFRTKMTFEEYKNEWKDMGLTWINIINSLYEDNNTAYITVTQKFENLSEMYIMEYKLVRDDDFGNPSFGNWQIFSANAVEE